MSFLTKPRIFNQDIVDLVLLTIILSTGAYWGWDHFYAHRVAKPTAATAEPTPAVRKWHEDEALRQHLVELEQQFKSGKLTVGEYEEEVSVTRARLMMPPEGSPLTSQQAEIKKHLDTIDMLHEAGDRAQRAYDRYKAGYLTEAQLREEIDRFSDAVGAPRPDWASSNLNPAAREFREQLRQDVLNSVPAASPNAIDSRTTAPDSVPETQPGQPLPIDEDDF